MLFYLYLLIIVLVMLRIFIIASFGVPSSSVRPSLLTNSYVLISGYSNKTHLFGILSTIRGGRIGVRHVSK